MNKYLSDKFKVLSAVSILMVVWIHTYYSEGKGMPILGGLETLIGNGLCLAAVPLFYVISGYLFFLKVPDGVKSIFGKMRKRVRTLLIPYFIVNAACLIFYICINLLALRYPTIDNVLNFHVLKWFDSGIGTVIYNTFWESIAFQLWFVRDLMIIVAFSPLLYALLRFGQRHRFVVPVILAILLLMLVCDVRIYLLMALFWFLCGGWLAMSTIDISRKLPDAVWIGAFVAYLALVVAKLYLEPQAWLMNAIRICGIIGMWGLYDCLARGRCPLSNAKTATLCSFTFFIYLIHEPYLNILKKLPLLVSRSEPMLIACYLLIPPTFCLIAIGGVNC